LLGSAVVISILLEMKGIGVELADIFSEFHFHQVVFEHLQLEIDLTVVIWQDRNAVIELIGI
jgi:hypothetical protein